MDGNDFHGHRRGTSDDDLELCRNPDFNINASHSGRRMRGTMETQTADAAGFDDFHSHHPPRGTMSGAASAGDFGVDNISHGKWKSLAEWRDDEMLVCGTLDLDKAFDVCAKLASFLDENFGVGLTWPSLCPEAVGVEPDQSSKSGIRIVSIAATKPDNAKLYQAPEIEKVEEESSASCQYSLACILYELLTGHLPERGTLIAPGTLNGAQGRALLKALAAKPSDRYGSCSSMAKAVQNGIGGRGWVVVVAVVCLVALAAGAWKVWQDKIEQLKSEGDNLAVATGGDTVESQKEILKRAAIAGDIDAMVELGRRCRDEDDARAAFDWHMKAAEAGDSPSMVLVGLACLVGDGTQKDEKQAAEWFKKAADAGSAEGRAEYALCLWEGRGVYQNKEEAFSLAVLAADEKIPSAMKITGLCYRDGIGVEGNPRNAAKWLKRAAEADDAEAEFAWAQILAYGNGVPKNAAGAFEWALKAAKQGVPEAMVFVGECYASGGGVKSVDQVEAVRWYRMAAENGLAAGQSLLGTHLIFGRGVGKDPVEGIEWLEKAAAQNYGLAFPNLARCYAEGWGVPKDVRKCAELLRKGAELGDPDSMGEYGASLLLGNFTEKDPAEGLRWMTKAAGTGRADMQLALANVMLQGLAGATDIEGGLAWLEKSAASDFPQAQSQLAIILRQGKITKEDPLRSFDLHLKAAKSGVVVSQSQIGTYCYNGYGCDRDYEEAFRWYKIAAEGGDEDAMVGLANCYDKGRGTAEDKSEALNWYKKSASSSNPDIAAVSKRAVARLSADVAGDTASGAEAIQLFRERAQSGDIIAMYDLAQRLDAGNGVAKDSREAALWWSKIAEIPQLRKDVGALQIGAWAQYGVHLLDGVGVARNATEAVKWLRKAAEDTEEKSNMGLTDANLKLKAVACRRLAECYDKGDGIRMDGKLAFQWYRAGAMNGDVECCLEVGDRFADGRAGMQDPMGCERWYERAAKNGSAEGAYRAGLSYGRKGGVWRSKADVWLKKAKSMGHPKAQAALLDLLNGKLTVAQPSGGLTAKKNFWGDYARRGS